MSDPVPDTNPSTRWLWVGLIVFLTIAFVIFLLNADGDEELETIPDHAITTREERLNTDLDLAGEEERAREMVNGVEPAIEVQPEDAAAPAPVETPE